MTAEIPKSSPEKKETLDDNALKFTLDGIGPEFLLDNGAKSFLLTTDWLEMGERSEKKLAHKEFENGDVQILLIQKFTDENGNRTVPPKESLSPEEYSQLLERSVRRVKKIRYEFDYSQGNTKFSTKYDEFVGGRLRVLEVDAENEAARESFEPAKFPYQLTNVTGKIEYYGYRVAELV